MVGVWCSAPDSRTFAGGHWSAGLDSLSIVISWIAARREGRARRFAPQRGGAPIIGQIRLLAAASGSRGNDLTGTGACPRRSFGKEAAP